MSTTTQLVGICLMFFTVANAQVGIGTANVHSSALLQLESTTSAFVLPRLTDAQMTAVSNPATGSMIFNTNENLPYFKSDLGWSSFDLNSNPTIILSRSGGNMLTSTATSYPINLSSSNIVSNSSAYFTVDSPGAITVSRAGVYLLSASISTSNMPAGSRNFYIGVYRSGVLLGFLTKSKLENPANDYWGATGTLMYYANAGDQFYFRYFVAHTATLTNAIQTICITKLN
ncbi:hypothetical protein [Flavobacterium sp.]|uniref:hypothetical protein n=1 Tax=Flavobacterium sp. TaxID=239 RepID=UPI0011FC5338|nr:hypothetical protein [Flavobacterium sp.]RZJ71267.1 MAG: hypothetical protein EOO49_10990 [Flavobacterium sp.]